LLGKCTKSTSPVDIFPAKNPSSIVHWDLSLLKAKSTKFFVKYVPPVWHIFRTNSIKIEVTYFVTINYKRFY